MLPADFARPFVDVIFLGAADDSFKEFVAQVGVRPACGGGPEHRLREEMGPCASRTGRPPRRTSTFSRFPTDA
ncbi:MAG: hypothetical protein MZV63_13520 [Marinilabiliales bacterium]|nr:hypothetical protein [Marinilabiliales bacterium]